MFYFTMIRPLLNPHLFQSEHFGATELTFFPLALQNEAHEKTTVFIKRLKSIIIFSRNSALCFEFIKTNLITMYTELFLIQHSFVWMEAE